MVIPAAEDVESMWIRKFGFEKVTQALVLFFLLSSFLILIIMLQITYIIYYICLQRREYRQKLTSIVAFEGTCLLEKEVVGPYGGVTFQDGFCFSLSKQKQIKQ